MGDSLVPLPVIPDWDFEESSVLKVELTGDGLRDLVLHLECVRPKGEASFEGSRSGILTFASVAYLKVERSPEFVLADHKWGVGAYTIVAVREVDDRFGRVDLQGPEWKAYQVTLNDWRLGWQRSWLTVICLDLRFDVDE